ncbi:MAG: lysophospholipid acyltransferase family protein [bacterium]|nr:lysophospholipid acyltransferase family protein [bacterium]
MDRLTTAGSRALLFAIGCLPLAVARKLCAQIAALYALLGGPRVADARVNLEIAFPDWAPAERERVLVESFANLGRSFAEVASMHVRQDRARFDLVSIEGRENLECVARDSGSVGALVVTAHLGSWEFCAAALSHHGLPVSVVQHGFTNPGIDALVTGWRERAGLETLSMGAAALGVFRALARGRYVALLMDQNASEEEGIYAPFFSREACTRSGPAQLAMTRDVPVFPVFFHRVGTTGAHIAKIGKPLPIEPEGDDPHKALATNVERMNAAVEAAIRESPTQWIWTHRRFKTRPAGTPSPYAERKGAPRRVWRALRASR